MRAQHIDVVRRDLQGYPYRGRTNGQLRAFVVAKMQRLIPDDAEREELILMLGLDADSAPLVGRVRA